MTPAETVTPASPHTEGDTDEFGSTPLLLHEEDALPGGAFRWRLVAQTDDQAEAEGVMELVNRRCFSEGPSVA